MVDRALIAEAERVAARCLAEDDALNDAATASLGPAGMETGACEFRAREDLVLAGWFGVEAVFRCFDGVEARAVSAEGSPVRKGGLIGVVRGPAGALLSGERSALNILCRLCGIATITRKFAMAAPGVEILDTRKTTPGLRLLEKYAVRAGGGVNHRMNLSGMAMFKDNHIAALGGIGMLEPAIARVRALGVPVQIEVDSLSQLAPALGLRPDRILLDNMNPEELREAVAIAGGLCYLEASGGITLDNVPAVAETGVNGISVGALTHSAPAADIGLDWREGPGVSAGR